MSERSRRKRYIVEREFQFKYSLLLASIGLFVAITIGGTLFYGILQSHQVLLQSKILLDSTVLNLVNQWKNFLLFQLTALLVLLILFLTLVGVVLSHKIAGPIFVLKRHLRQVTEGAFNVQMKLRKGDEFQNLKDAFNDMTASLQERTKREVENLKNLKSSLEKSLSPNQSSSFLKNLEQLIDEKEKSLQNLPNF